MTLVHQFRAARRVSTPLLGITSPDPLACMRGLTEVLNGKALLSQPKRAATLADLAQRPDEP